MKRIVTALSFAFCIMSAPALAQAEPLPIEIVKPNHWNAETPSDNSELAAQWSDPKTESRIEVYSVRIARDQHLNSLRQAFEEQLAKSNFNRTAAPEERTIPLVNATKRTGTWTEYEFVGADIPISVVSFVFSASGTAIFVVGYFARPNRTEGLEAFEYAISQMIEKS